MAINEEMGSQGSFRSKSSSKFEAEPFEREPDDVKSRFESDSSAEDSEEKEDLEIKEAYDKKGLKNKLNFLRSTTSHFQNMDFGRNSFMPEAPARSKTLVMKTNKKDNGNFEMSGWVLKRATTTYMGMANWQKRYIWLKNEKLYFYDGDDLASTEGKAKKVVNMSNVKCVCYHYD